MMDQGWDPTQSPKSPNNDKIFKNISQAYMKAEVQEITPDIKIDDESAEFLANIVAGKSTGEGKLLIKKSILKEAWGRGSESFKATVKSQIIETWTAKQREDAYFRDNTISQLGSIGELYKEFLRKGGVPSLVGRWREELTKEWRLPGLDPDQNKILTRINLLYWNFRNELTGAAFSPQEARNYLSLFPEISDGPEEFFLGLDAVNNAYEDMKASAFRTSVGKPIYNEIFGPVPQKTDLTEIENIYVLATDDGEKKFDINRLPADMRKAAQDILNEKAAILPGRHEMNIHQQNEEVSNLRTTEELGWIYSDDFNRLSKEFESNLDATPITEKGQEIQGLQERLKFLDNSFGKVKPDPLLQEVRGITEEAFSTEKRALDQDAQKAADRYSQTLRQQERRDTEMTFGARQGLGVISPIMPIEILTTDPIDTTFIGKSMPNLQKLGSPGLGGEQSISEKELDRVNQQMMTTMNNGMDIKYQTNENYPGETKDYKAVGISFQQGSDGILRWGFIVTDPVSRQQRFLFLQDKGIVGINRTQAKRLDRLLLSAEKYTRRGR
jgi:hypothetical protein